MTATVDQQTAQWSPADVAGYLAAGVTPSRLRTVLAEWPTAAAYRDAWNTDPAQLAGRGLPEPHPTYTDLPADGFLLLAGTGGYPPPLGAVSAPPLILFGRGNPAAVRPGLAVIGSRAMSAYGKAVVDTSVAALDDGIVVISGAAAGCDTAAHRAALARGLRTVAVLPTGPDIAYPAENASLLDDIVSAGGAVISEHPFGTGVDSPGRPALTQRLMARNRIIIGLAGATVLAEAQPGSGSVHGAWLTLSLGRPLLVALPRPAGQTLPGTKVPAALGSGQRRTADQLKAMGAPAGVIQRYAGTAPLAHGAAADRDELTLIVQLATRLSPEIHPASGSRPAAAGGDT